MLLDTTRALGTRECGQELKMCAESQANAGSHIFGLSECFYLPQLIISLVELALIPGKVSCQGCTLALSGCKPSVLHGKNGELTACKQFRSNYYECICERNDNLTCFTSDVLYQSGG